MKLKPVDNYENPKYSSYKLKTGAILPIGIGLCATTVDIIKEQPEHNDIDNQSNHGIVHKFGLGIADCFTT